MSGELNAAFHMADVRNKRISRRRAVAVGELHAGPVAYPLIVERRLPKGDALVMAEIAGLQGAKMASMLMPLCHPLPLELVQVFCAPVPERQAIRVWCECASEARTGVEMEALAGVNAALLTLYDLSKPVEPALRIEGIRLLFKEGGKRGVWLHPDGMDEAERERFKPRAPKGLEGAACAVITLSDRASEGTYEDASGPTLVIGLKKLGGEVVAAEVLPDGIEPLAGRLQALAAEGVRLCLCTGGTGLGGVMAGGQTLGSTNPSAPVDGYLDYLDASGQRTTDANGASYIRQWSIATSTSLTLKTITVRVGVTVQLAARGLPPNTTLVCSKADLQ